VISKLDEEVLKLREKAFSGDTSDAGVGYSKFTVTGVSRSRGHSSSVLWEQFSLF
jgi:hypothetical protein